MLVLPLLLALSGPVRPHTATEHGLIVRVDSARHAVVLTAGTYDLAPAMEEMPGMPMGMMSMDMSSLLRFQWPVTGWIRGVRLRVTDATGKLLSSRMIHHINVINFARRQLFYPIPERMIALGEETGDLRVPATIGIPVSAAMPMAMVVAWHNHLPKEIKGVSVEMTIEYSPTNLVPKPVTVMPVYLDVMNPVAADVDFDLPAGTFSKSRDFKLPLGGRIIGAGGHEHDFGTGLTLHDITDTTHKRQVVRVGTKQNAKGALISIDQLLPGITGDGIKMQDGHSYRLTGGYNNPTGKSIEKGAMIHMILLFVPDHPDQWPKLDTTDPDWIKDTARLKAMGEIPEAPKH